MNGHVRFAKGATARAGLALALVFLTGCFSGKVDLHATVSEADRVSGTLLVAGSRHGTSPSMDVESDFEPPDGLPVTSSEPYEDTDFKGRTFTFSGVPLATFNDVFGPAEGGLVIVREEDTFRVAGTMDLTSEDPHPEGDIPSEIRIAISFPGPVTSSNGVADGTHVEWRPPLGEKTKIMAVAAAMPERGSWRWAAVLGVGILAFLGIAVTVFAIRRRQGQRAAAEPPDPALGV